jgi:hypothetical protein
MLSQRRKAANYRLKLTARVFLAERPQLKRSGDGEYIMLAEVTPVLTGHSCC